MLLFILWYFYRSFYYSYSSNYNILFLSTYFGFFSAYLKQKGFHSPAQQASRNEKGKKLVLNLNIYCKTVVSHGVPYLQQQSLSNKKLKYDLKVMIYFDVLCFRSRSIWEFSSIDAMGNLLFCQFFCNIKYRWC